MASTVKDLIQTAVKAAQNQAAAQTATKAAVAQIAARRPAAPPAEGTTAGGQNAGTE